MRLPHLRRGKRRDLDLMVMNLGFMDPKYKDFTLFERDNLRLISELHPRKIVFTHIEETNQMSYDDYAALETKYENMLFGFDGMRITI